MGATMHGFDLSYIPEIQDLLLCHAKRHARSRHHPLLQHYWWIGYPLVLYKEAQLVMGNSALSVRDRSRKS